MQNQVSRLLAVLLERPGKLVAREELRSMLWPRDTFVDFDSGLNKAISELRAILRDSAPNPGSSRLFPVRAIVLSDQ